MADFVGNVHVPTAIDNLSVFQLACIGLFSPGGGPDRPNRECWARKRFNPLIEVFRCFKNAIATRSQFGLYTHEPMKYTSLT